MSSTRPHAPEPRVLQAADELAALVRARYPAAQFRLCSHPEESTTTLLEVTVDLDDPEEVLDLVFERMEQLRIDEGVPILVLPLQTLERAASLVGATTASARATVPAALL